MKKHIFHSIGLVLVTACSGVLALGTADLLPDSPARELLDKNCIRAATSGVVPVPYDSATRILDQQDLLQIVQAEYARSISKEGSVKFPIIQTATGQFHYVNEKGQRTDIVELHRSRSEEGAFDIILQASGKRFFGRYDVIIHVQFQDASDEGLVYTAQVHAYPHNGPMRFFARKLGSVERYFRKNTSKIELLACSIGQGLAEEPGLRNRADNADPVSPKA
jgi:hypothetical protein